MGRHGLRLLLLMKQPPVQAETRYIIMIQSTDSSGSFLFLCLLALFALGSFGALFFYDLVSGSLFLGVWVLLVEYGRLNSSGDGFVCGATLGSTIDIYFLRCRGLES